MPALPKLTWTLCLLVETYSGELTVYADHDCVTKEEAEKFAAEMADRNGWALLGVDCYPGGRAKEKPKALPSPVKAVAKVEPQPTLDTKVFTPALEGPVIKSLEEGAMK